MNLNKAVEETARPPSSSRKVAIAVAIFFAMAFGALGAIGYLIYSNVVQIEIVEPKNPDAGPMPPEGHTLVPAPQGAAELYPPVPTKDPFVDPWDNQELPPPVEMTPSPKDPGTWIPDPDWHHTPPK